MTLFRMTSFLPTISPPSSVVSLRSSFLRARAQATHSFGANQLVKGLGGEQTLFDGIVAQALARALDGFEDVTDLLVTQDADESSGCGGAALHVGLTLGAVGLQVFNAVGTK